jgi:hypothetical protein
MEPPAATRTIQIPKHGPIEKVLQFFQTIARKTPPPARKARTARGVKSFDGAAKAPLRDGALTEKQNRVH